MKNNYKIIAKFEYNNNKYFIANVNDSRNVLVKYNENKKIETKFCDEEYELVNLVYNSLCINKDKSVYIKDETIDSNSYKIYYDINSKNYFWNSKNNEEINRILNFKYNNMIDTYFSDYKKKEDELVSKIEELLQELREEYLGKLDKFDSNVVNNNQQNTNITEDDKDKTINESESKLDKKENEKPEEQGDQINDEDKQEKIAELPEDENEENSKEQDEEKLEDSHKPMQTVEDDKIVRPLWVMMDLDNKKIKTETETETEIENETETQPETETEPEPEPESVNHDLDDDVDIEEIGNIVRQIKKQKAELRAESHIANDNEKIAQEKTKEENVEYFTKLVRFKKRVVPILVSAVMTFGVFSPIFGANGRKEEKIKQQIVGKNETVENVEKKKYNYSELAQALEENPYLTQEEKDFISKFKIIFDEDNKYMDLDMIDNRYRTLKISYSNENKFGNNDKHLTVAGSYNETTNQITMNGVSNFKEADKKDFAHELGHVTQKNSQRYIMELINEMYTREKLRKMKEQKILDPELFEDNTNTNSNFGNGYSNHMYIGYIFASLMDKEALKEYQYTCDDKVLVDRLCQIDANVPDDVAIKNAYQLLECIDSLRIWNRDKQIFEIDIKAEESCKEKLNYYFLQKNGKNIEEDLNCVIQKAYYNDNVYSAIEKTLLDEMKNGERSLDSVRTILPRTYFSDEHNTALILFNSNKIEITDDLCEKYRQNYIKLERGIDYER